MIVLAAIFWLSLLCVVYSYIGYPWLLRLLSGLFGTSIKTDACYYPGFAIVIPAFNEEKVIGEKLKNVLNLDYPADKIAVWIGSDCSTDATHDIVKASGDTRVHLWVAPHRMGKTEVINRMMELIDSQIVLFTDADIVIAPDSLLKIARNFFDPLVGGVAGHTAHSSGRPEKREEYLYRSFEAKQKQCESMLHSTISAFGSFYAIRRSLFKPFPPNTYSNDDVLMPMNIIRQGYRMLFDPEAVSWEQSSARIRGEFKRRIRIGAGNFQAFFWLLDFLNPMRGWPWFCYVSHKVTRWFSPICMGIALISAMALALLHAGTVYSIILGGMLVFLAAGLSSFLIPARPLRFAFYFISMNVALALGFFRYLSGIKSAAWSRTERVSS
jgi:cellulose synthase/poly-beta-1,6-N-acetylglucosamine synthase-like glycosyltransferase